MKILKIIDKKYVDNEQIYLIHWLGQRSNTATWHPRSELQDNHPSQIDIVKKYDNKIQNKYDQLRLKSNSYAFKTTARKIKMVSVQNMPKQQSSQNEQIERQPPKITRKQGRPYARTCKINESLFEQAKQALMQEENSIIVPSQQFVIYINSDKKYQPHWVYGDCIKHIISKKPAQKIYVVLWQNNEISQVSQQDLIQKEPLKICQFYQKKLKLHKNGRKMIKLQEQKVSE